MITSIFCAFSIIQIKNKNVDIKFIFNCAFSIIQIKNKNVDIKFSVVDMFLE
jgi:hypothetical protein